MLYGFNLRRASTLNRVADREGIAPRTAGAKAHYTNPLADYLVAARLTQELVEDGTATATLLNWNGSTWADGDSITVREFWLGSGESVPADTEVLVAPVSGEWVVAPLEGGVARNDRIWVYFALTERMDQTTGLQASATVEDSIGDGAPVATTAITVHDPEAMFADCPDGAFGLAVNWGTAASPEYHIVECQRVALRVKLRATQPICNDDNGDVTASLEYVESIDEGEHVIDPEFANIVVTNPARHAAFGEGTGTGDFVWARRVSNQVNGSAKWEFEIDQAEKHEVKVPVALRAKPDGTVLEWDLRTISVESCQDDMDDTTTEDTEANVPIIGKADSAINKGSSGTVSIWSGTPGSETDTGDNISSCYNRTRNITSGAWVQVVYVNGSPYVAPLEC